MPKRLEKQSVSICADSTVVYLEMRCDSVQVAERLHYYTRAHTESVIVLNFNNLNHAIEQA